MLPGRVCPAQEVKGYHLGKHFGVTSVTPQMTLVKTP